MAGETVPKRKKDHSDKNDEWSHFSIYYPNKRNVFLKNLGEDAEPSS